MDIIWILLDCVQVALLLVSLALVATFALHVKLVTLYRLIKFKELACNVKHPVLLAREWLSIVPLVSADSPSRDGNV